MGKKRITEAEYKRIKSRINTNKTQKENAKKIGYGLSTTANIMNTDSFRDYKDVVRSQHPPNRVYTINKKTNQPENEKVSMWGKLKALFS